MVWQQWLFLLQLFWQVSGQSPLPRLSYTADGQLLAAHGYRPSGASEADNRGLPLAVFLHGMRRGYDDAFASDVTEHLAVSGFVALSLQYANEVYPGNCQDFDQVSKKVAEGVRHFCSQKDLGINCALGVATVGYSLGGQVALKLRNFNENVSAALSIAGTILFEGQCLMNHHFTLGRAKRRITVGSEDHLYGSVLKCVGSSGYDCGSGQCIQPDGSGFYVVTDDEIGRTPNHHYHIDPTTKGMAEDFKLSDAPWGFSACTRWLADAASTQCRQP